VNTSTPCRLGSPTRPITALLVMMLTSASAQADEEFIGPFPSWRNVKADYGASGDGVADDTAAIQKALDDLQLHKDSCVLYFPAGTYRIADTVKTVRKAHTDGMGVAIVGEDPTRTVIRWDGKPGGTMIQYDAWYSRISRLTLDGRGKAAAALAYGPAFSTYNETSDMVFRDVVNGMVMGAGPNGQAENEVLRCTFQRCSNAGLLTTNFNSMDIWVWYCKFEDCGYGMYNGAGNFHAFQNVFLRSKKADIGTANLMVFSFINNTSVGSNCFMDFACGHTWGAPCSVTGNRIIEPTGDWAIRLGSGGPFLLVDNVIKSRPGNTKPVVQMTWGDQVLIGNSYTVENAVQEAGRFTRFAEKLVDPRTVSPVPPVLPATPANHNRRVFEVPAGADAVAIQAAINLASQLKGERPVVHLPKATYKIASTLVVPAGGDVQLVGDAAGETATVLQWTGPAGGLVLQLKGPSLATVRDLSIHAGTASAIRVDDCDQPGASIFGDQVNLMGTGPAQKTRAGLLVNGVENACVLMRCLQGGSFCEKWVSVIGGPKRQAGHEAPGQVSVLAGATGSADAQYAVANGGRLLVRSVYHEMSSDAPQGILLNDAGTLAVDATRFSYKTSPDRPLIEADGFRGSFALLTGLLLPVDSTHTARIEMKGDGSGSNILCMGNIFWVNELGVNSDKVWLNKAQPPANALLLNCNVNSGTKGAAKMPGGADGFAFLENRGTLDEAFVLRMLQPLREGWIWLPDSTPEGTTSVRLHRVICSTGKGAVALELRAGQ